MNIIKVTISEARAKLSYLIRQIQKGERVIITKKGIPVVELISVHKNV